MSIGDGLFSIGFAALVWALVWGGIEIARLIVGRKRFPPRA